MLLPLAYYDDPVLRKKGIPVEKITEEIRQLAADMVETMRENNGIGLAAPQIHRSLTMFVTEVPIEVPSEKEGGESKWLPGKVKVFINPKILSYSSEKWIRGEGCLSIPQVFGEIVRPVSIVVEATDLDGNLFTEELFWLEARCVMHENDHINGVLFIDRVHGKERKALEPQIQAVKKKYHRK